MTVRKPARVRAAIAASVALGGCAGTSRPTLVEDPLAVGREDICAIAARPEHPGREEFGLDGPLKARADEILKAAQWQEVRWRYHRGRRMFQGRWGRCENVDPGFKTLSFSAEGRFAMTYGNWLAAPLYGGGGYCLYEKTGDGWQLLVCEVTEAV